MTRRCNLRCLAQSACLFIVMSFSTAANAQHMHGLIRGPNGGQMLDVVGIHAELIADGSSLTVSVFNEDSAPLPLAGFSVMAFVNNQGAREALALVKITDNTMRAQASKPVTPGTIVALRVKSPQGSYGQIRFKL